MKANFVIEMTADATGSTALTATRQAFVGLQSGAGEVRIGTQNTVGFGFTNMFTPGGLNTVSGELAVNNGQQAAALNTFGIKAAAAPDFVSATNGDASVAELEAINFALAAAGLNNSTAIVTDPHTATTGTVVLQTAITAGGGVVLEKQVQDLINAANQAALDAKLAKLNAATYTSRLNNTVSYISPSFGGLQATAAYNYPTQTENAATGEKSESTSMQLGAVYNNGPLSLGVALTQDESKGVTANRAAAAIGSTTATTLTTITGNASAASTSSATATTATTLRTAAVTATNTTSEVDSDTLQLGAKYNFGPATLSLIHVQKDGKVDGAKLLDKKVSQLGVSAPIGKTTLFASYGDGEMKIDSTNKYDLSGYQVGAYYAMSKRTTAYALVGESKTEGKDGLPTLKENQYAVGLRHSF